MPRWLTLRFTTRLLDRGVQLAKKWLQFVFAKNCGFQFGFRFIKLTAVLVFSVQFLHCVLFNVYARTLLSAFQFTELHSSVDAIFHLRLYSMTLEMTYFRAELVQLIVSRSDSELEVQRYGMKKHKYFDCRSYHAVRWIVNEKMWKTVPKPRTENRTAETEFLAFEFWGQFGSVIRKPISDFLSGSAHPYCWRSASKLVHSAAAWSQVWNDNDETPNFYYSQQNRLIAILYLRHVLIKPATEIKSQNLTSNIISVHYEQTNTKIPDMKVC